MRKDFLKYGNLVAFITVVVFNILAATGVLGGIKTGEVSEMYKSLLAPADYAFSIWSVIYILLAIMVYRQMTNNNIRDKIGYWFFISCILNVAWIFAWQLKNITLSFILISILLLDLLMLMRATKDADAMTNMAVGLYTGWINIAMLANLGTLFIRYNWHLFGMSAGAAAVIGLVFGWFWIGFFIFAYSNIFYAVGACWGYMGILVGSQVLSIRVMAIIGIVIFVLSTIFVIIRKKGIDAECKC